MKKAKSPCIDVCKFIGPNGWCLGCGRTKDETKKWKSLKPYDIKNLQKVLAMKTELRFTNLFNLGDRKRVEYIYPWLDKRYKSSSYKTKYSYYHWDDKKNCTKI